MSLIIRSGVEFLGRQLPLMQPLAHGVQDMVVAFSAQIEFSVPGAMHQYRVVLVHAERFESQNWL